MYQFNKILICVGLSSLDKELLAYANILLTGHDIKNIEILHVSTDDKGVSAGTLENELSHLGHLKDSAEVNVVTQKGNPTAKILKYAKEQAIDLIIMGRKKAGDHSVDTGKVVNSAECSVLLVPEGPFTNIKKIVVAMDFSRHGVLGIDTSEKIAENTQAEILLTHVYRVPSGYHTSGKNFEDYAKIMEKNARKDAEKFFKKHPLKTENFRTVFILDDNDEPSDKLYQLAEAEDADLICVSSKGLNSFTDIFFDSTAEMLFKRDNNIPLLVVKDKKENKGFLNAIRDL